VAAFAIIRAMRGLFVAWVAVIAACNHSNANDPSPDSTTSHPDAVMPDAVQVPIPIKHVVIVQNKVVFFADCGFI
jgi:hypothetical protein